MRFPEGQEPGPRHFRVFALVIVAGAVLGVAGVFLPLTSITAAHSDDSEYNPSYFSTYLDNADWPVANGKRVFISGVLTAPCVLLALAFRGWPLASVPMVLNAVAIIVTFFNVNYLGQVMDLDSSVSEPTTTGVVAMAPLAALIHAVAGVAWIRFRAEYRL